mmetsp:Transcript_7553/g.17266  ORF Transcript_7553/g.17266 Transcript_7553/m.17266 type:complete len:197 (+) Transcript_7553:68-658(+)
MCSRTALLFLALLSAPPACHGLGLASRPGASPSKQPAGLMATIGPESVTQAVRGSPRFQRVAKFLLAKQAEILEAVEREDGSGRDFARDPWTRPEDGSFGVTTCLEEGDLVEKGAASVSIVHGELTEDRARSMSGRRGEPYKAGQRYSACALSLVFHSRSPLVPTFRADVRYFEVGGALGGALGEGPCSGWCEPHT